MIGTTQERAAVPQEPIGVLAPDGTLRPGARVDEPPELVLEMYRWMVFGRLFDTRLFNLQRQGRVATYAPVSGQEASQVGCGLALEKDDWLLATYRDDLVCTVHGRPAEHVVYYFSGHPKAGMVRRAARRAGPRALGWRPPPDRGPDVPHRPAHHVRRPDALPPIRRAGALATGAGPARPPARVPGAGGAVGRRTPGGVGGGY